MRHRTLIVIIIVALCLPLGGCAFFRWLFGDVDDAIDEVVTWTDPEIEEQIGNFDGRLIEGRVELGSFIVDPTGQGNGIGITLIGAQACAQYGWTQVIREWLDDQVVKDPTDLPPPSDDPNTREKRKEKITEDGYVVDGAGDGSGLFHPAQMGRDFTDNPHMPDADIEENTLKPDARLYVLEAETCVKCLNQLSDYTACFKWFYVRIKSEGAGGGQNRSYLITFGTPSNTPSDEFKEAVDKWQQ